MSVGVYQILKKSLDLRQKKGFMNLTIQWITEKMSTFQDLLNQLNQQLGLSRPKRSVLESSNRKVECPIL